MDVGGKVALGVCPCDFFVVVAITVAQQMPLGLGEERILLMARKLLSWYAGRQAGVAKWLSH